MFYVKKRNDDSILGAMRIHLNQNSHHSNRTIRGSEKKKYDENRKPISFNRNDEFDS